MNRNGYLNLMRHRQPGIKKLLARSPSTISSRIYSVMPAFVTGGGGFFLTIVNPSIVGCELKKY
jgi:hypothetical protein